MKNNNEHDITKSSLERRSVFHWERTALRSWKAGFTNSRASLKLSSNFFFDLHLLTWSCIEKSIKKTIFLLKYQSANSQY